MGKLILIAFLFTLNYSFSQNKVKIKNVKIEFPDLIKDTIFRGYPNVVLVKGIDDCSYVTLEMGSSSIVQDEKQKNKFIIKASNISDSESYIIIKQDGKEIKRQKVIVTLMTKDIAKRLKSRSAK